MGFIVGCVIGVLLAWTIFPVPEAFSETVDRIKSWFTVDKE